jgi:hypothetical protein
MLVWEKRGQKWYEGGGQITEECALIFLFILINTLRILSDYLARGYKL